MQRQNDGLREVFERFRGKRRRDEVDPEGVTDPDYGLSSDDEAGSGKYGGKKKVPRQDVDAEFDEHTKLAIMASLRGLHPQKPGDSS